MSLFLRWRRPTSLVPPLLLPLLLALVLAGCGGGGPSNVPVSRRGMSETMDIDGFFADLTQSGVRVQRVNAETAVYKMAEGLFVLENIRVEFFDEKGMRVVEELFCDDGLWYTQPHPQIERGKSDMDLSGNVFYRSLESGSALRTESIYYNNELGRFKSDTGFVQLMLRNEANSMTVLRGEGFQTDKGFQNWGYAKTKTENQIYDEEEYRSLVGEPPADAPSFQDYEGL